MRYCSTVLMMVLLFTNCQQELLINTSKMEQLSTTVSYKTIQEIDVKFNELDIYYTDQLERQRPVVVYVHGGAWSIGDKASQLDHKINLFRSLDYIFVSINYRLSPNPPELLNPDRIKFPVHNNDVAEAIKWVHDNIQNYGGNPQKIALLGHSAGAHLVTLTGTNSLFLNQKGLSLSNIKGVAAIDTEGYDVNENVKGGLLSEWYINAFGLKEEDLISASPIEHLNSKETYPNFFIAKRGSASRLNTANVFIDALKENNISIMEIDGSIYNHEGINDAIGAPNETVVTPALKAFLQNCFE